MSKFLNLLKLRGFSTAADSAVEVAISTDTQPRLQIDAGGKLTWGAGGATTLDTNLYRSTANTLKTDDMFIASGGLTIQVYEVTTDGASIGTVLAFDGTKFAPSAATAGSSVTISDTAPASPTAGNLWYESDSGKTFIYYDSFWVEIGGSADYDNIIGQIQAKGDILTGTASQTLGRTGVGANNTRLVADSAQTTGLAWASDTQNTVIDAKGDLLVGTADNTVARQAVGTNGQFLMANSTATNGLVWLDPQTGFRNVVHNGNFIVDQRGNAAVHTVAVSTTAFTYYMDRWFANATGGAMYGEILGAYENTSKNNYRFSGQSGNTGFNVGQRIESINVRHMVGSSATLQFKVASNVLTTLTYRISHVNTSGSPIDSFGTLGSPTTTTIVTGSVPVTSTLTRQTVTFNMPAGAFYGVEILFTGGSLAGFNECRLADVQLEPNPVPTAFENRPIGTELALCQRYYWQWKSADSGENVLACGAQTTTTSSVFAIHLPVEMRSKPTVAIPAMYVSDQVTFSVLATMQAATNTKANTKTLPIYVSHAAQGAQFRPIWFIALNASGTMNASAEL